MKKPHIYIDENKVSKEDITSYCQIYNRLIPQDYIDFLLQFNGGAIYHPKSMKLETLPLTRFHSLGDLILQEQTNVSFNDWQTLEDDENYPLQYSPRNLLPIATTTYNGYIHISLDESDYGNIYETEYHGGTGLNESKYSSFTKFLKDFEMSKDEEPTPFEKYYYAGRKIFDPGYFWTKDNLELGFERFKEVFKFYGNNPNLKEQEPLNTTLLQTYLHHNLIFEFLVKNGANTDGLYNQTMDLEKIRFLHNEMGLDINESYKGYPPIICWSGCGISTSDIKVHKEFMDKLENSNLPVDYSIKDKEGKSIAERMEILNRQYEKYYGQKCRVEREPPSR